MQVSISSRLLMEKQYASYELSGLNTIRLLLCQMRAVLSHFLLQVNMIIPAKLSALKTLVFASVNILNYLLLNLGVDIYTLIEYNIIVIRNNPTRWDYSDEQ